MVKNNNFPGLEIRRTEQPTTYIILATITIKFDTPSEEGYNVYEDFVKCTYSIV